MRQPKATPKKEEQPVKPSSKPPNKTIVLLKSIYDSSAPSSRLQKFSIWFTMLFTLITGWLAIMTYNSQAEIKGMKEVLQTFNPNIRWIATGFTIAGDSVIIRGYNRNYGTRPAIYIFEQMYVVAATYSYKKEPDSFLEMVPNTQYAMTFHFHRKGTTDAALLPFTIASKMVFTDPITKEKDSAYSFFTCQSPDKYGNSLFMSNKEQQDEAVRLIKKDYSDF